MIHRQKGENMMKKVILISTIVSFLFCIGCQTNIQENIIRNNENFSLTYVKMLNFEENRQFKLYCNSEEVEKEYNNVIFNEGGTFLVNQYNLDIEYIGFVSALGNYFDCSIRPADYEINSDGSKVFMCIKSPVDDYYDSFMWIPEKNEKINLDFDNRNWVFSSELSKEGDILSLIIKNDKTDQLYYNPATGISSYYYIGDLYFGEAKDLELIAYDVFNASGHNTMTDDGKKLIFISDINVDDNTGVLYLIQKGIKPFVITENVLVEKFGKTTEYDISNNGNIICAKLKENRLFVYAKGLENIIIEDVYSYEFSKNGDVLVYLVREQSDENSDLFMMKIGEEPIFIDNEVFEIQAVNHDGTMIAYSKFGDNSIDTKSAKLLLWNNKGNVDVVTSKVANKDDLFERVRIFNDKIIYLEYDYTLDYVDYCSLYIMEFGKEAELIDKNVLEFAVSN